MKTWTLILAAASMGLVACVDGKDGDSAGGDDGDFAPSEGDWSSDSGALITDECGIFGEDDTGDTTDTLTVTATGEGTFTIVGDGTDLSCTLSGKDFTCDPQIVVEDLTAKADIIVTTTLSVSGSFTSETEGAAILSATIGCEGGDCGLFESKLGTTMPCTSSANVTLSFNG